jgi:cell wall-associated NlpC family hydrolase
MAPGDRTHRRPRAFVAMLAGLTILSSLLSVGTASAGTSAYAGRDGDSGMPPVPIVYPKTDSGTATRSTSVRFSDVDSTIAWAVPAIDYVAGTNDWMRDFAPKADGTYPFKPSALETRKYFARSIVKAFAPAEAPDGTIVFADLDPSTAWYRYAAVAVKHGWMTRTKDGSFLPDTPVTMAQVHRALVLALGLRDAAKALDHLSARNGVTFELPPNFGTTLLGMRLSLRYNAPEGSEANDVGPTDQLNRAQVAYSLFRAKTQPTYNITDLLTQYSTIRLPFLGPRQQKLVQWGVKYVGYPYIWAGEWGLSTPEPAALGGQPRSGFDCSGLTWWLLRMNDDYAWKVAPPRPYAGWSLAQRGSADMARATTTRLRWDDLRPGDIAFYDGNFDGTVDHVDTYIGNGYALDSSSTPGGVTIMWIGDGWYRDHFVYGRRIFG